MSDEEPTVAVPVSLIEAIDRLIAHDALIAEPFKREVHDLLPKPTTRRLRVVDLDAARDGGHHGWGSFDIDALDADPDVMAIVEQGVEAWVDSGGRVLDRIRAAIEEAVGRG